MQNQESSDALEAIRRARNQGDPCAPEKLFEAGFDGDEHLIRETTAFVKQNMIIISKDVSEKRNLFVAQSWKSSSSPSRILKPGLHSRSSWMVGPKSLNIGNTSRDFV